MKISEIQVYGYMIRKNNFGIRGKEPLVLEIYKFQISLMIFSMYVIRIPKATLPTSEVIPLESGIYSMLLQIVDLPSFLKEYWIQMALLQAVELRVAWVMFNLLTQFNTRA